MNDNSKNWLVTGLAMLTGVLLGIAIGVWMERLSEPRYPAIQPAEWPERFVPMPDGPPQGVDAPPEQKQP